MSLGKSPAQSSLFGSETGLCEARLSESSIYRFLHRECHRLFPDELFSDLFKDTGRRSVPPRIVAVVMVLQRLEGLSDREAVDRFAFDLRWKYAAGGLQSDYPGFVHTVLVDMRARLRASEQPNRIFDVVLEVAKQAGLVGRKRVLDSTALYDAVATQDTVTMIRSAIRGLLGVADIPVQARLRGVLKRDDDYSSPGKPVCDWDDEAARESLIDGLVKDAHAVLLMLDGLELTEPLKQAVTLLATVVGQDIEEREGLFRIARRVAPDRMISVVDPESRHGHKTAARGFDGYKGHIALDPESEVITATAVTAGNVGDGVPAPELLSDVLSPSEQPTSYEQVEVYGDASYGGADLVEMLEAADIDPNVKVQSPPGRGGMYSQDEFRIDLDECTVQCPAGHLVTLRLSKDGSGEAKFGQHCNDCPLRTQCTESKTGRTVYIHPKHRTLDRARRRQRDPNWKVRYRATRPKVERKLAHMMRRKHGGRRARVRGQMRIGHDFSLLAAAVNLARLAILGVTITGATMV
jgi:hypothetical protein